MVHQSYCMRQNKQQAQTNCIRFRPENCDYQWNWSGQKTGSSCVGLRSVETNDKLDMAEREKLRQAVESCASNRRKCLPTSAFDDVEEALLNWVFCCARTKPSCQWAVTSWKSAGIWQAVKTRPVPVQQWLVGQIQNALQDRVPRR